jgi:hypothetical protein
MLHKPTLASAIVVNGAIHFVGKLFLEDNLTENRLPYAQAAGPRTIYDKLTAS